MLWEKIICSRHINKTAWAQRGWGGLRNIWYFYEVIKNIECPTVFTRHNVSKGCNTQICSVTWIEIYLYERTKWINLYLTFKTIFLYLELKRWIRFKCPSMGSISYDVTHWYIRIFTHFSPISVLICYNVQELVSHWNPKHVFMER